MLSSEDGRLIIMGYKTDNFLTRVNRLKLIGQLILFLENDYPAATNGQIIVVCEAALQLFPSIGSVVSVRDRF